jgi:site-specific DNA recombinase
MVFRLMAVMAEFESDIISERVSSALQHKKRKGERAGYVPFGYRVARDGRTLEVDDREQGVIRRIRELRERHTTLEQIANDLNATGMPTRSGDAWKKQYVFSVMRTSARSASYREISA